MFADGEPHFFRWYWAEHAGKERLDGIVRWEGERGYAERIIDTHKGEMTSVYYHRGYAACYIHPINFTLPHPNFNDWRYAGQALVNYEPVHHWTHRVEHAHGGHDDMQFYDLDDSPRTPVRFDFHGRDEHGRMHTAVWEWHEFDGRPVSADVFTIPPAIEAVCNRVNATLSSFF